MKQTAETKRKSRLRLAALILVCCTAAGATAWRLLRAREKEPSSGTASHWITPEDRVVRNQVNATGTIRLKTGADVRVGSQLSGIVRRLYVTVGSQVQQGQTIAEIDSRPIEARVQQARAQLAQAQTTLAKATVDADRSRQLFAAGIISRQQLQDATATLESATAAMQVAQSGLDDARVDLAYVDIRAPIAGTIASVSTQQGETVAASFATPTFVTIIQRNALEVVAMVDEADIGNVHPGEAATFTTETWPELEFTGTVLRIAPVATIISGVVNYEVAISIQNKVNLLKPDMTSNVNIVTAQHHALMIPALCLHRDQSGSWVYIRSATGAPLRHAVMAGNRSGGEVEIVQGLSPDSRVLEQVEKGANP